MLLQYQPELVDLYHSRGMKVNTWTVNDEENMRDMIHRGVDASFPTTRMYSAASQPRKAFTKTTSLILFFSNGLLLYGQAVPFCPKTYKSTPPRFPVTGCRAYVAI